MRDLLILLGHLLTTIAKLLRPGGARAVAAEIALLKQRFLLVNRSRRRAPHLSPVGAIRAAHGCVIENSPCTPPDSPFLDSSGLTFAFTKNDTFPGPNLEMNPSLLGAG